MNVSQAPKARKRIVTPFNASWRIQSYDADNLYPQHIRDMVAVSSTATTCLKRYAEFIEGNGIHSQLLADCVMNTAGETLDDIHHLVAQDKATYNGFALHVNFDATLRVCDVHHVPFENCRLEEPDSEGNVAHVCVFPDWSGQSTRNGSRVKPSEDTIDRICVFNPDPVVVAKQIEAAGGFDAYKGQILYCSGEGMRYPLAIFDAVLTEIAADEGLSNVKLRNIRNNFLPSGAFVHYGSKEGEINEEIAKQLADIQGDMNACKMLNIEIENVEEKPEFVTFPVANYDRTFEATTNDVKDNIYSAFGQEGWLCVRNGKVGFGGEVIRDIEDQYAKKCARVQRELARAYMKILSHATSGMLNDIATPDALTIEPLTTIKTEGGEQ